MAIELIKISEFPESVDLKDWFVVGDVNGVAYKLSKDNLEAELGINALMQFGGAIVPTSTPEATGDFFWIATEEGTYTDFGGVVVPAASMAVISRIDGVFTSSITTIPQPENRIDDWTAGTHVQGDQRFHNGQIWEVVVPSTTEEPEMGTDWIPKLDSLTKDYVDPTIEKVDKAFILDENDPVIEKVSTINNLPVAAYGTVANYYAWTFPIGARKPFQKISVLIGVKTAITEMEIRVKAEDGSGALITKTRKSVSVSAGSTSVEVEFDLPILIDSTQRLFVEVLANGTFYIYRSNPASIYTLEEGYPPVFWSSTNDLDQTIGTGVDYMDIAAFVFEQTAQLEATDRLKEIILETSSTINIPEDIQKASDITNELYESSLVKGDDHVIFDDNIGAQGGTYYAIGFPVGVLPSFRNLTLNVYLNESQSPLASEFTAILRRETKTGSIVSNSLPFSIIGTTTGSYEVVFDFQEIISETGRLFMEIRGNGKFGIYRRFTAAEIFTQAAGYPPFATATIPDGVLNDSAAYFDIWFKTDTWVEDVSLTQKGVDLVSSVGGASSILPNENIKYCFAGSSVTGRNGYLQNEYVKELIENIQAGVAGVRLASEFQSLGMPLSNRKYFKGEAVRIEGVGTEIEMNVSGNEVSIIQSIERSNVNASEIEVYIDDVLHDTFNNFNTSEIGSESKSFVGDGTAVMFDLGRAFTYGHSVTLNGSSQVVTHNINQGAGFTIPVSSDCAIIRRLGQDSEGRPSVTHWLWFRTAPLASDDINISYDYGATLIYEKTTIGEDTFGNNESPYGDGDVSFDPLAPSSISTVLEFRQTDERVVKTYRFLEDKTRNVKVRIKGLLPSSIGGTPYFILNFVTNRYFHFMNAGIGGWDLWDFDKRLDEEYLRGWQRVVEFNPDKLVIESTPNDDWIARKNKLYSSDNVTLAELRTIRTLPLRSIAYDAGTDTYNIDRWVGEIADISETSVTVSGTIDAPIVVGDVIRIGQYWGNNEDYLERIISSVAGNVLGFDKPISDNDSIYGNIPGFVGKEISVASIDLFTVKLNAVIDNIQASINPDIYLLENPMPNVLFRELWGYPIIMDMVSKRSKVFHVDYNSLREWQKSVPKTTISLDTSSSVLDTVLGKRVIEFGAEGQNVLGIDVLQDGKSIYGSAVVQNGWAYVVNQTDTGLDLNKIATHAVNAGQVFNGRKPRLVLLDDTLTGDITVEYASELWSGDSTHLNDNSSKLYADFLMDAMI